MNDHDENKRIESILELYREFQHESNPEEKRNIIRTIKELILNEPIELPKEDVDEWKRFIEENE